MTQIRRFLLFIFLLSGLVAGVVGAAQSRATPSLPTTNAGWEEVGTGSASGGGISDNDGYSSAPSLAMSPDGLIVTWMNNEDGDTDIYVRRWDGLSWVEMGSGSASGGGISNNDGGSGLPSLAISLDGPIVAWHDDSSGNSEIYVRYWDGSAWAELGPGSATGGGISNNADSSLRPSLAISPDGPIVAWEDWSGDNVDIYVRRWNGSAWVEMGTDSATGGGISNNDNVSYFPSLAISPDGPIVAWEDWSGGDGEIYIRRWDGSAWVEMGTGSATGGGISNNDNSSFNPSLTMSPDGPIVAWEDWSDIGGIYVRRWDGSAWVEVGAGSATGDGISDDNGIAWVPSPAMSPDGPLVAWLGGENNQGAINGVIYVRRWSGSTWAEMGDDSASGSGISGFDADYRPSLAVGLDGRVYVAWGDDGAQEIYVKQSPAALACYNLNRTHSGNGGDPSASPDASTNCGARRYTAGELITLNASPAAGWRVAGWSGTNSDTSLATTNTLTMPAISHSVSVAYETIPLSNDWAYVPLITHQPCFSWPNEQEPNNTQPQANGPLCNGRNYSGLPTDHFDIFYFDLGQTADVVATLDNHTGSGVQLALHHQAITGNPLDVDFSAAGGFRVGAANAAPGRYYVVIYAETPGPATPYTLRATFAGQQE